MMNMSEKNTWVFLETKLYIRIKHKKVKKFIISHIPHGMLTKFHRLHAIMISVCE